MVATTALLNVQEHNFGRPPGRALPQRNARIAILGEVQGLTISTGETVIGLFKGVRYAFLRIACSCSWRLEGTGDNPLLAAHFDGGVLPSGTFSWAVGQVSIEAAIVLAAASPPVVPLTGRIVLENLVDCELGPDLTELEVDVTAVVIEEGDAVVSLNVPFAEIDFDEGSDFLPGFNLAGGEFGEGNIPGILGTHYVYPTAQEMDYFAGKGGKLFRLPVILERAIQAADLAIILALVDYAATLGCTVMVDAHQYAKIGGVSISNAGVLATFKAQWATLAAALADRSNVIIDPMNEPNPISEAGGITPANWRTALNSLIDSIRTAGFTGPLAVEGSAWSGAHSWITSGNGAAFADGVVDPLNNYVFNVHQYWDSDSSGQNSDATLGGGSTRLVAFTEWCREHGFRAVLSETGWASPTGNVEGGAGLAYCGNNRDVWLGWCIWAAGRGYALFDPSYMFNVQPTTLPGTDKPQMAIIAPHATGDDTLVHPFLIERSGSTVGAVSVQAKVEGTGANPVTAAKFANNTLPTITATFEAGETRYLGALEFDAGSSRPATRLTGRIILRAPVDCRLDAAGAERAFALKAVDAPATSPYDLVEENWVVHAPSGQSGRVTWLDGGGFEIEGAANTDAFNIALWCKEPPPTNYELNLLYEKNEDLAAADGGGRFVNIWYGYVGSTGGRPADVSAWTSSHYRPGGGYDDVSDAVYGDFGKGIRNSLDTETTVSANRNEVRLVCWDEGTDTRPTGTPDPPAFPMSGDGSEYALVARREGETLSVSKEPAGEEVRWETPLISSLTAGGRLGIKGARGRGGIFRPRPGTAVVRDLGDDVDPPPVDGKFPGDWRVFRRGAATGRRVPVSTAAELRAAIAAAQSGDRILLPVGGNIALGGDLVITKAVSGTDAYYIATDTDSDDPASFCRLSGGDIVHRGARRCVMHGIRQIGYRVQPEDAKFCQWERFWISGLDNDSRESGPSYREAAWFVVSGSAVDDCLLGFVYSDNVGVSFMDQVAGNNPTRLLMTHIDCDQAGPVAKFMQGGRNADHGLVDCASRVQYCLDRRSKRLSSVSGSSIDWIEMKTNGWHFFSNTIEDDAVVKIRHGRLGVSGGSATPSTLGNVFESNLWVAASVELNTRGAGHKWLNNWIVRPGGGQPTKDSPLGSGQISVHVGVSDGKFHPPTTAPPGTDKVCGNRMSGYGIKAGGNRGFTVKPQRDPGCNPTVKPKDCVATSSGKGRNSGVSTSSDWGSGIDYTTQISGADLDKVPHRMLSSEVGPRAWRAQFAAVLG